MYDLIPELHNPNDLHLTPLPESIWIGVIEKINPSPPVPRKRTNCFSQRPVYLYKGRRVFSMLANFDTHEMDFYFIPDNELIFVTKKGE